MTFATDFSTRYSRRARSWRRIAAEIWLLIALGLAMPAHGAGIVVRSGELEATEEGFQLNALFDIGFNPVLENALNRGVPLYFDVEFALTRPRAYWFDETIVEARQEWKVSYNALTRQYRFSVGALYQNFSQLAEVKQVLSRVRGWLVADKNTLRKATNYEAAVRVRLDVSKLPKPFQVNALASDEWNLSSEWYRFSVRL